MVLRHFVFLSALGLTHANLEGALGNACEADAKDSGHGGLALLQSGNSRRAGGSVRLTGGDVTKKLKAIGSESVDLQLPLLTPSARTFISSDPKRSADWWLRYMKGTKRVESWLKADPSCQEIDAIELEHHGEKMSMIFIKDHVRPYGSTDPEVFVNSSDTEWQKVMERQFNYSPWVDFHDGLSWNIFDVDAMAKDHVLYQRYTLSVLRFSIPATAWTLELVQTNLFDPPPNFLASKESLESWSNSTYANPDLCRNVEPVDASRFWWKSTFAAVDPPRAVDFAVKVLGAYQIQSPYPWPPQGNCTASLWVRFPTADGSHGIEFHFVESPGYPPGNPSITDFHNVQHDIRNLDKGVFDRYLYNSIVLKADSLDPFIERLRSESTPFLLLEMDQQKKLFSLFFSFPGNDAIVIQIQGSNVTSAVATPYSSCPI